MFLIINRFIFREHYITGLESYVPLLGVGRVRYLDNFNLISNIFLPEIMAPLPGKAAVSTDSNSAEERYISKLYHAVASLFKNCTL